MKKALSILLVIATLLACAPASQLLHPHAEAAWDGTPATAFASGNGTEASPYLIRTVDELVYLAISVNQGNSYEGQYIALANDIEFSSSDFEEGGSLYNDGNGWTPIGWHDDYPFKGHFDGMGHSIRNLVVSPTVTTSYVFAGLFGRCAGTIHNLHMDNCRVEVTVIPGESTQNPHIYAGMIVGRISTDDGLVTGCSNNGSVTVNVQDQTEVSWCQAYAGGIVGYVEGYNATPIVCTNSGPVTINLALTDTYKSNSYAGGIVGLCYSPLADCTNTGAITILYDRTVAPVNTSYGHCYHYLNAGGLTGVIHAPETDIVMLQNCANRGVVTIDAADRNDTVSGSAYNYLYTYAGGITGNVSGDVTGCRNDADVTANVKSTNTKTSYYSYVNAVAGGIAGRYHRNSKLLNCINNGDITADISFTSVTKSNKYPNALAGGIAGQGEVGVGYNKEGCQITNCMNRGAISAASDTGAVTSAGGIAGVSTGTTSNCINHGPVNAINRSRERGDYALAGGIAGDATSTVKTCYNTGTVHAENLYTYAHAGGIVGYHKFHSGTVSISNSYNIGNVSCTSDYKPATDNSSNSGGIITSYKKINIGAGGILGYNGEDDSVGNCYNIGLIQANKGPNTSLVNAYAGAIVGYFTGIDLATPGGYYLDNMSVPTGNSEYESFQCTDEQMRQQETFYYLDFDTVWTMEGDPDYPYPELTALVGLFDDEVTAMALISGPAKTTYVAGEYLDLTGVQVQATCMDGEIIDLTDYQCSMSQTAPLTAGTHTVELRYNALRVSFEITVVPRAFDSIEVTDLLIPVYGATPDTSVTVDNFYHTVSSLDWSTDEPFTFGKEYALTLTLAPTVNALYSADTVVLVNGAQAQCRFDEETGAITATVQFPAIRGVYFHVLDAQTGEPISGATITMGQNELTTGVSGTAFFEIAPGSVTNLRVTADPYKDYIVDNFVISEDPNVYILMSTIDDSIQAAFCNGTDVLLNSTQINTYAPQLTAQIQVSGRSARKILRYEIVQKNLLLRPTVIATSTNGSFTIPNTSFKKNADVYVRMVTQGLDGEHTYECKLKIKTLAFKLESELDFGELLPFASETGFSFPSGTPILDGTKFSLPGAFGKNTKPTVQLGNDKIVIGLGTVQDLMKKDQTKKDSDDIFQEMLDDWREQDTYDKESKVTGMVALVIEFDENGVTRTYGQCYVEYKLEVESGATVWLWFIPIRVDIEVGFGGKLIVTNLGFDFENSEFLIPTVQLGLDGSVEARLGIGCKVISAGIYGSAELEVIMDLLPEVAMSSLELSGELGLHATYNGLFVKKSLKYPLLSAEFSWPTSTYALRRSLYTAESYELLDRSYLAERSDWLGQIATLSEDSTVSALQTSAYEGIAPQMAVCGDTVMMVFMDDDGSERLNYQHLYYSLYDRASRTWSEPAKVDDNGLSDMQFEVISDGSHIHIIYTEVGQITEENQDDNEALAATVEVATAVYDPDADCFTGYTVLTDNDYYETLPQLAATDEGLVAAWATNLANDVFGQNANNLIHRSIYSGGSWSAPEACGPMGATVASLDAGRLDGETYIAAIRDTDCDLATVHDRFLYLTAPDGTVTQVQTGTGENDNATFLTIGDTDRLVWYADSNLHTIAAPDAAPEALFDQAVASLSPDFQFIALGTGSAILYTCTTVTTDDDGNKVTGSDVFGLFYRDGQWGEPVAVTHTQADRYVDAFAVFADGEDLVVPYRSTAATFINGELDLACDFMTTNVPFAHNIGIDALSFPPSQLFQGDALDVTVRIANHAWKDVDAVTVAVTDDSGNVVFTQTADCTIGSGGTENLTFSLDKSLLQLGSSYTVSISPTGYADSDASDNTSALALWYSDLSVQAKQLLLPDGNYLQYTVTNLGNLPSGGELQVYCMDGDTKTQVTIVPLDTLEPGKNASGLLPVKDSYYDAGTVFVSVLPDTEELYTFNDTVTVPVQALSLSGTDMVDQDDTAAAGPALEEAYFLYDLYTGGELTVAAEENGFAFSGIEGLDAASYTYADATLTLPESYLQSLAVGYHHLTLQYADGDHTEDVLLTVEVTDSTPVPVTVTAQQNGTVTYDTHPVEPGVDFTYSTLSEGAVSYAYSADGTSWQDGLPTDAGTYTILVTVATDTVHHFAGTQCSFELTIGKAARAISSPLPLDTKGNQQTFGNAVPTAGAEQGQILYGYSTSNDAATVAQWSAKGILPAASDFTTYYIFAKITEGDDYLEAVSLGLPLEAHVHSYTETSQAPSCDAAGSTEFVCSCGDRYDGEDVPATGHTPVTDKAVDPTCTETGLTEGSHCGVCGKVLTAQQTVPVISHTPVTDKAVTPTCTETGLTEGSHCGVCGQVLTAQQTVPAAGHSFSDSWLHDGEGHYRKCTVCQAPSEQASHSFSSACDATCDTCGYSRTVSHVPDGTWVTNGDRHWQTCTVCGTKVNVADHRYDDACDGECNDCGLTHYVIHDYLPDWFLDETYHWRECANCQYKAMYVKHDYDHNCDTDCNTCGHTRTTFHYYTNGISKDDTQHWRTCLYCHERILVEDHRYDNACDAFCDDCNYVRAISHEYPSTWTSDETGHWHECEICQHKLELLGHSYDNLCDTSCNDCGYVRTVDHYYLVVWSADEAQHWHECHVCGDRTDVTGHSWKEATCYEPKTCTVCGTSVGTAKGHSWKAATCTEPKTCTVCGETEGTENWHSWKDGTCTEPMICTVCGEIGSPALGHSWQSATCTEPKTCSVCGVTAGKANGHSWILATCEEPKKCSVCGVIEGDPLNHDWHDATCTEPMVCNRCGEKAGRALGHNMLPADCTTPSTCARCGHTAGSPLEHNWSEATCTGPKYCHNCGATTGGPLDHSWAAATCTEPETCTDCGATRENPTGHNWQSATCYKPDTCLNCGETNGRPRGHSWTAATCTKPQTCRDCGLTTGKPAPHIYSDGLDGTCDVCGIHRENVETRKVVHMFRMYNPNTGEHFYTGSTVERDNLIAVGWQYEGVGFTFPANTGLPVHRLFQPSTGEHLYTMDEAEKNKLMAEGWNYEGIAFNSAYDTEAVQHRLHNPNATVGAYHFTFSIEERDTLIAAGWEYQGIGWYSCWK